MGEGSVAAITPTITLFKFGVIRGHDVFSFMYSAYGVSALLGSLLVITVYAHIGFRGMIGIGLILALLGLYLTYRLDEKHVFNYQRLTEKYREDYEDTYVNYYGLIV